ncbi:hypothetical protein SAMN05660862_2695 [Sphingobacterium psychroaquaticum]|uniref:Uncharacterized protein n=1 Tax=Sphingobacterium psychroaquaticum TaxID=561061 RepID=A0A1X7KDF1_9SPHI|nr:hypothetical protein SAMN05660862_2695 [Sphingobacterium psychroaquaticum]
MNRYIILYSILIQVPFDVEQFTEKTRDRHPNSLQKKDLYAGCFVNKNKKVYKKNIKH